MKIARFILATLIGASSVFGAPSLSQAAFQETLWGARPAAMAGAYTALADDANAPAYNPAGISLMTQSELTFMYAKLFSGVDLYAGQQNTSDLGLGYFSFSPAIKDKAYGSYAISWTNLAATSVYREDSVAFTVADSYQFDSLRSNPILSYGANLKYLRHSFTTDNRTTGDPVFRNGRDAGALTVDLGLQLRPHVAALPGLKFGLAAQNITEPNVGLVSDDRVPMRLSFGVAYQDPAMRLVNPAIEISRRDGRTIVAGAWESWVANDTLAFRLGANSDELGGGLGYQFRLTRTINMRFDYAILWPLNVDGTNGSHRVSVSTAF